MKDYGFIPEGGLPAGIYEEYCIPGALEFTWSVTGDYAGFARNHCAAVCLTNLARFFDARRRDEGPQVRRRPEPEEKTFRSVYRVVGNGPVIRFRSRAKRFFRGAGYRFHYDNEGSLDEILRAVGEENPVVMLLCAGPFDWHWVIAVGFRKYRDGRIFLRIVDNWSRRAGYFWCRERGARRILSFSAALDAESDGLKHAD